MLNKILFSRFKTGTCYPSVLAIYLGVQLLVPAQAAEDAAGMINSLLGRSRLLLLVDQPSHHASRQLAAWGKVDFSEWSLTVVCLTQQDTAIRHDWQVGEAWLILIGIDGTEKLRLSRLASVEEITQTIDQMPIRLEEIQRKNK